MAYWTIHVEYKLMKNFIVNGNDLWWWLITRSVKHLFVLPYHRSIGVPINQNQVVNAQSKSFFFIYSINPSIFLRWTHLFFSFFLFGIVSPSINRLNGCFAHLFIGFSHYRVNVVAASMARHIACNFSCWGIGKIHVQRHDASKTLQRLWVNPMDLLGALVWDLWMPAAG